MSTPYLSQISAFAFGKSPVGWLPCNGQLLPINSYSALFALLGTTYGGDGKTTFALPNLQGATGLGAAGGYALGATGGESAHTLVQAEMPAHLHPVVASSATTSLVNAIAGNFPAAGQKAYSASSDTTLGSGSSPNGGGQPHPNMQPYTTVQFCIAVQGIYPPRS